jgi:S-formylglutathione hydrolase FrmB
MFKLAVSSHKSLQHSGPRWETFHTTELPSLLTQQYPASTLAAVARVSMGGLGAMDYTARHPGMFAVAGSFQRHCPHAGYPATSRRAISA